MIESLLSAGVLVLPAVPGLRAGASSAYRRVFPLDAARIGLVSLLYVVAVLAFAVFRPAWLRVPALLALATIVYWLWKFRPGYGAGRGLPPGSLYPLPVAPWSDPSHYAKQAARYGAIFKMSQFGQPMVCVVGLERANRLLLEHDDDLVAPPLPFSRFIEGGYLRYLSEETHLHYRRFFRSMFHSDVMTRAEPRLAAIFRAGFERMAEESRLRGSVNVRSSILRMMFVAWSDLFYGIDDTHPDFNALKELFRIIDTRKARWASRTRIDSALAEIESILRRQASSLVAAADTRPCFLAKLAQDNPEALSDRTVLGNFIYIMQVTWGDVSGLLLWVFRMLSDNPEWRDRLRNEQDRGLAKRIVSETLRLEQSESRYRRATADIELDGFLIPRKWLVRMCVRESHQDPSVFPDAQKFDPDRFLGRQFTRSEYAPFGAFRLACIGEELTKHVGALFALELTRAFAWRVTADGPATISSWAHNAPSPRWSVRMTVTGAST